MLSWARKLVIVAALGTIRRELRDSVLRSGPVTGDELGTLDGLASVQLARLSKRQLEEALLQMDVLRRSVVILTVLEGLRAEEVAGLLGTDQKTAKAAQARGVAEMTWRLAGIIRPVSAWTFGRRESAMVAFG
jgi:DNA-directed RNA polymerase specialized sigma24 family protein